MYYQYYLIIYSNSSIFQNRKQWNGTSFHSFDFALYFYNILDSCILSNIRIYVNSKMQLVQLTWSICSKILDSTMENNLSFIEIRTTHRKLLQILTISQLMRSPMIPTIVKRAIGSSYHVIAGPRTRGIESRTAETGRASSLSIL